jgi:hypothetical protein
VEVFGCNVSEDALKNMADTGQLPIYRFRVNSVNGSRLIKATFTFRTLRQLFAPVCGRSERLRNVLGQSCDSLPVLALAAVRNDKRTQLDPDAQNEDRVYASMGLTKDRKLESVFTVSKDAKTIRVRRLQKDKDPSESHPDGVSLAEVKQTESTLIGLWLPYFFRAEQHLESYNSKIDTALGLAVDLTIGLVPGGKYLGEGVWKLAEEALSKGAESVRQETLQSNPGGVESASPSP